jgi:hypothetical protein
MKLKYYLLALSIALGYVLYNRAQVIGRGLHIVNQTNQRLLIRFNSTSREYSSFLDPSQSYFFSEPPLNLTVYSPGGSCSHFYDIGMNTSIFDTLLIRAQRSNAACVVIGYTGRTRQVAPRAIPPIAVDPTTCKGGCWNPTTGAIAPELTTGVVTGRFILR